jgi:insulysin
MTGVGRITDTLEKPLLDDRSYRIIRLKNQLEALLVPDPDSDKASASVNVQVGNFSDDDDMPGMAHAVEHLLFMGTEKVSNLVALKPAADALTRPQYPVENAYNQYLSTHSGSSNAYTAPTETNYYFEIAAQAEASDKKPDEGVVTNGTVESPLYGALDRFAQFFIAPLFLSSTLDRELKAVDSENKKNLRSDN